MLFVILQILCCDMCLLYSKTNVSVTFSEKQPFAPSPEEICPVFSESLITFCSLKYLFTKFDPGLGRSPGEGKGYPVQYSGLENSMYYTVHEVAKSQTPDRTEWLSLSLSQVSCKVVWWFKSDNSGFRNSEFESPSAFLLMWHTLHTILVKYLTNCSVLVSFTI